ncbi:MAG: HPr kinase/phosphorylase [Betaproteobacteria bacterium]|nr:HPr kinase/phosphorylase [Betaproteobacteria bacterium]
MLDVQQFYGSYQELLRLTWVTGQDGGHRHISGPSFESADLVGHLNLIHLNRIQVLGLAEVEYYNRLDPQRRSYVTAELIAGKPPAIVIADGLVPPAELFEACDRDSLPLMRTSHTAARAIELMRIQLSKLLAPKASLHGVFMDVLGLGVLISGESGQGKSELALELITRGHGLVADDVVEFARIAPDAVEGRCPPLLRNLLEVRGLGLLDIRAIFGETSVRRKLRLRLIVHLVRRSAIDEYERLPLEALTEDVLGLPIRKVVIPVAAGRNLAVLVEAAVRNTVLQLRGIDTLKEFTVRQQQAMSGEQG